MTLHVAMKHCMCKALPNNKLGRMLEKLEHLKDPAVCLDIPILLMKVSLRFKST